MKRHLKTFDGQVRTSLHKSKNRIAVKYVVGCAIGMQLHSHGLVKAYVTDCARVIHSHGLVKHVIEIKNHNLKTVM